MSKNTAILFFSYSLEKESQVKKLHPNQKRNTLLLKRLYRQTKNLLQKQSLPVFEYNEDRQRGIGFGQRLSHAIAEVFNNGFQQIIVVGNDCPFLSKSDLQKAEHALKLGKQVVGRSCDGGAFLIGLSKEKFCASKFSSLPWTTAQLGCALTSNLLEEGPVEILSTKADLDDSKGLNYLLGKFSNLSFARILNNLFVPKAQHITFNIIPLSFLFNWSCFFRGPPLKS